MHLSGQTPLFRAKNLEKYLGVEKILLKLEGSNPTGHKNDRIAESLVQDAYERGYDKIFVYGSVKYILSIYYFSGLKNIKVYVPKMKNNAFIQKKLTDIHWTTIKVSTKRNMESVYEEFAKESGCYYISEWERDPFIRSLALQKITEECLSREEAPTCIYTQLSGGYTVKSVYHELMRKWVNGDLEKFPEIHCGARENFEEDMLAKSGLRDTIEFTNAKLHTIDLHTLKEASKLLRKLESIKISPEEAYSLAALINSNEKKSGVNLVILNDGKNDIDINEISKDPNIDRDEIVAMTRSMLEPYNDSVEETADAVDKAIEKGFIIKATQGDEVQGICVVVHMGFTEFIPTYHLAYIGVKKGKKGRGVATMLINQAIEKSDGKLSLHVDIPNSRAKKLYEKMGFVHMYNRMLYKG